MMMPDDQPQTESHPYVMILNFYNALRGFPRWYD